MIFFKFFKLFFGIIVVKINILGIFRERNFYSIGKYTEFSLYYTMKKPLHMIKLTFIENVRQ